MVSLFPISAFFMMTLLSIPFKITLSLWHFSVSYVVCLYQNIPNQNETLCPVQQYSYPISFKESFKTWWFCSELTKKFYCREKKYVSWPYDCVRRVLEQCLFFKAQLVENHLCLSACGVAVMIWPTQEFIVHNLKYLLCIPSPSMLISRI